MSETSTELVTLVDLLDRLAEPADPSPISMMPQTWGWVALALLIAVALLVMALWLFRRYRANAYRRQARVELRHLSQDPAAIALLLRRTALAAFPRREIAGLTGRNWLDFLSKTGRDCRFDGEPGETLLQAPYRNTQPSRELEALADRWIRTHRREASS